LSFNEGIGCFSLDQFGHQREIDLAFLLKLALDRRGQAELPLGRTAADAEENQTVAFFAEAGVELGQQESTAHAFEHRQPRRDLLGLQRDGRLKEAAEEGELKILVGLSPCEKERLAAGFGQIQLGIIACSLSVADRTEIADGAFDQRIVSGQSQHHTVADDLAQGDAGIVGRAGGKEDVQIVLAETLFQRGEIALVQDQVGVGTETAEGRENGGMDQRAHVGHTDVQHLPLGDAAETAVDLIARGEHGLGLFIQVFAVGCQLQRLGVLFEKRNA